MAGRFKVETVFKAVDRITAPVSRMQNRVSKMTRSFNRGLKNVNRSIDKTISAMRSATGAAIKLGAVGIGAITAAVGFMIREFSKIEDAQAAFTPLLGGAKKAREMVAALNKTAATTPFQFNNLASQAKQLLPVMSGNINKVIKTIRMLGDTAGGNAQKLDSITRGFTKAMLKGKVDMESLNMIGEAGVPIFTELAKSMGVGVNKAFFKMISAGKVTTTQLTKAFEKMTAEGGIFFKGMEIASKTISGMWSTLKDNVSLAAAAIGSAFEPTVKALISRAIEIAGRVREWAEANQKIIRAKFEETINKIKIKLTEFIESIRKLNKEQSIFERLKKVLNATLRVVSFLVKHRRGLLKFIAAIVVLSTALKALSLVLGVVNTLMAANPVVLITLGIIALIAALASIIKWWDKMHVSIKLAFSAFMLWMGPLGWFILAATLIVKNWAPISEFFKNLWGGAVENFKLFINTIKFLIPDVVDTFKNNFQLLGDFFKNLWSNIINIFDSSIGKLFSGIDKITGAISDIPGVGGILGDVFGFGKNEDRTENASVSSQVISPQERISRTIEERSTRNTSEVVIRDETGRAQATDGKLAPGIILQPTGAF